jgi:uncharacterized membrane protein
MLNRLVQSVVVAVVVTLVCILLGAILIALKVDIAVTVGDFLKSYAGVIGVLSGLWFFATNGSWPIRRS